MTEDEIIYRITSLENQIDKICEDSSERRIEIPNARKIVEDMQNQIDYLTWLLRETYGS